jgi:excinuclease ABC subunit C
LHRAKSKNKPCFYYQINRCFGPCSGEVSIEDYKREVVDPIISFLSGKKKKIVTSYKLQVTKLTKKEKRGELNEEEARELLKLKFKVLNMEKVLAHANILSISEKYVADVVELAKVLSLPKVPERIEGYDISNIFGRDAVGSMVVFKNGEPYKNEYRKFKIKIGEGKGDDVGMMREVLRRRLAHSPKHAKTRQNTPSNNKKLWPTPDLIIVDGGKGQLNGAIKEIKKVV